MSGRLAWEGRSPRADLWVAILHEDRLSVRFLTGETCEVVGELPWGKLACLRPVDIDGDGIDDLAVVDEAAMNLEVFRATGGSRRKFFSPAFTAESPLLVEPMELMVLDSNKDSMADLAVSTKKGTVLVYQGNGFGSFADPGILYAAPEIETSRATDLDGDGLDEILVAAPIPGLIVLPGK